MNTTNTIPDVRGLAAAAQQDHTDIDATLSAEEMHRLTLFKWRYAFQGMGFKPYQVEDLVFLTWLRTSARVQP